MFNRNVLKYKEIRIVVWGNLTEICSVVSECGLTSVFSLIITTGNLFCYLLRSFYIGTEWYYSGRPELQLAVLRSVWLTRLPPPSRSLDTLSTRALKRSETSILFKPVSANPIINRIYQIDRLAWTSGEVERAKRAQVTDDPLGW